MSSGFNDCYAPAPLDRKDPKISPLFIDGDKFPDCVLVVTCAKDELCNEGEELAEKIIAAKPEGKILKRRVPCAHGWDKRAKPGSEDERAKDEMYGLAVEVLTS